MSSLLQIYCFQLVIIFGHARTRRSSCVTRQCSAYKTSRSCKTALAPACVTDVGLRPNDTKKSIKVKKKRKKYKMGVTLSIIIICYKCKLSPLAIKTPKKSIKELKNTQKNNKIADAVVVVSFFSCVMLLVLLAKIFMFILNDICFTLLSILVLKTCCSNNISNWHLPLLSPPFCLKCIAVVRIFFLVSTAVERIKQDEQLLMCNWSDSRQGENALNTKLLQFLSFINCAIQSLRLFGLSPFTPSLPWVNKTEFLLTISIQHQTGKWWEYRKISLREL